MKLRIKNNRQAPYGVEKVGGGYEFIQPGKTRTVDAASPSALYGKDFLDVEAEDSEVEAIPRSLKAKAEKPIVPSVDEVLNAEVEEEKPSALDHDGDKKKGGSVKGFHATAAKGARRRRGKAARK